MQNARVFISYSHESPAHAERVLTLADRLRADGVDARIDRYVAAPAAGWPRWVAEELRLADFVLCVCTPRYRSAFEGRADGTGLGVNQEGFLALSELYEHGNRSSKYVPVVFREPGHRPGHGPYDLEARAVPGVLKAFQRYALPDEYEELYRRLSNQHAPELPALGELRRLPPLARRPPTSDGFAGQDEPIAHVGPPPFETEPARPQGLYLIRIVNPPTRNDPDGLTAVWLAAHGERQCFLDSARVAAFQPGFGGAELGVRVEVDAAYSFVYDEDSDVTHPLDPAISLGPRTRRTALLTFRFLPGAVRDYGSLQAWIGYHTSDGATGSLALKPPDAFAAALAQLLGEPLRVSSSEDRWGAARAAAEQVDARGVAMGVEEAREPVARFELLRFPTFHATFGYRGSSPGREEVARLLERARAESERELELRRPLLEKLAGHAGLARFVEEHAEDMRTWDLAGALDLEAVRSPAEERSERAAKMHARKVRHVLRRDDALLLAALEQEDDANRLLDLVPFFLAWPVRGWQRIWPRIQELRPLEALSLPRLERALPRDEWLLALEGGELLGAPLHLRGSMNRWVAGERFERVDATTCATELELPAGRHELKVADDGWHPMRDLGLAERGRELSPGGAVRLRASSGSPNVPLLVERAGRYRFELELLGGDDWRLSVSAR